MCGIAGWLGPLQDGKNYAEGMAQALHHRGPDHQGMRGVPITVSLGKDSTNGPSCFCQFSERYVGSKSLRNPQFLVVPAMRLLAVTNMYPTPRNPASGRL